MRSGMLAILIVGALWACFATPGVVRAGDDLSGYCCFCANCTTGNAFQCSDILVVGESAATVVCPDACSSLGCQFSAVSDGACALAAACPQHAGAPALSPIVLGVLLVALGGWGVYRVRRV